MKTMRDAKYLKILIDYMMRQFNSRERSIVAPNPHKGNQMKLSPSAVAVCCPKYSDAEKLATALNNILPKHHITTLNEVAAFISQCGHESIDFTTLEENLNYSATALRKVWPRRFPDDATSIKYARSPQKIANKVYASRMGNGDEASGDGWKYHGRGAIQLTGHDNYAAFANSLNVPIDSLPSYLLTIEGAIESVCWYWTTNNLNKFAAEKDLVGLTKKINGGDIGLDDRVKRFERCLEVLKIDLA